MCDLIAEFSASLLQCSVSHDPSEIILICFDWWSMIKTVVLLNIFVKTMIFKQYKMFVCEVNSKEITLFVCLWEFPLGPTLSSSHCVYELHWKWCYQASTANSRLQRPTAQSVCVCVCVCVSMLYYIVTQCNGLHDCGAVIALSRRNSQKRHSDNPRS